MSTFTQWNGPGEIGGRIHIKELTEMYDAFKQLSNEIHAHINDAVGATYTLDSSTDKYTVSGGNWAHGFDKALENLLNTIHSKVSALTTTVNNNQAALKDTSGTKLAADTVLYSKSEVDSLLANKANTFTVETEVKSSGNPVSATAVKTALDKKQDTLTFATTVADGDTNPVTADAVYDALADYIPTSKLGNLNNYATIGAYIKAVADSVAKLPTVNSIYGKNEPTDSEKNLLSQIQTATNNISILTSAIKTLFKTSGDGKVTTELKPGVFKDMDLAVADFDASSADVAGQTNTKSLKTDDVYAKDKNYIDVHNDVVFRGAVKVSDKPLATEAFVQSQVQSQVAAQMDGSYATKTELAAAKQTLTAADNALTTKIDKAATDIRAENTATKQELVAADRKLSEDLAAADRKLSNDIDDATDNLNNRISETAADLNDKIEENKEAIRVGKVPVGDTMRWGDAELEYRSVRSTTPFTFTFKGEQHTINLKTDTVELYVAKNVPEGWHALDGSVELSASEYPELAAVMKENVTTDKKIWLPYVAGQIIKIIA